MAPLLTIAQAALAWHAVQSTEADFRHQDAACYHLCATVEDGSALSELETNRAANPSAYPDAMMILLAIAKAALTWRAVQSTETNFRVQDAAYQHLFDAVEDGVRQ
jgi:hypothetical protein